IMSISKGIALITGSAQGIGRGIALRLAKDGFDIALNDVPSKSDQLRAVAEDINKLDRKAHIIHADVTVEEQVKGMVQDVTHHFGGLDVMVANAGIAQELVPLISTELDVWERVMAVNARGAFLCYRYAAAQMIKQGRGGRLIAASSVAGKMGHPLNSAYTASKFAVRGLTQTAALELGRYGITVNSYAPGVIQTPMSGALMTYRCLARFYDTSDSKTIAKRPVKHNGQPEDIAAIVSYLASKEAQFITGKLSTYILSAQGIGRAISLRLAKDGFDAALNDVNPRLLMSIFKGVALVTGSAQGIGHAIALRLARDGFDVALNDLASKSAQLHNVAKDIGSIGRKTCLAVADVSDEEQVRGMVQHVANELGGLDVMVANAGIEQNICLMTSDLWEKVMAVNARGPFLCYKHAATQMIKQGRGGRLIAASSVAGKTGTPLISAYCASKFAVRGLTQTAALELARYDITANSYAPGLIRTAMGTSNAALAALASTNSELVELMKNSLNSAIKREGQPEEVAGIVSYLASKEAQFVTGQCLNLKVFMGLQQRAHDARLQANA
ncbi:NAD(P)-binding protein, partial [Phlebopus sp. FC_14]